MSILEEVEVLKKQQQEQAEKKHREDCEKARSLIPEVAEKVKVLAIKKLANSKIPLQTERVSLFKKRSFFPVEIRIVHVEGSPVHSMQDVFEPCPELHKSLIAAIEDKGFYDVSIRFYLAEMIVTAKVIK